MFLGGSLAGFATSIVLVAAGYQSFQAIDTKFSSEQEKHWLTFWTLYGVLQFTELVADVIGSWIPFYHEIKLGLLVYLAFFDGAIKVYNSVGKKAFKASEDALQQLHEKGMQNEHYKMVSEKVTTALNKKTQ